MTNFRLFQTERVADNFEFNQNGIRFSKRVENAMGKGKLLVTSNSSFSHSVFKRLVLQTSKNQGLFGKGLTLAQMIKFGFDWIENIGKGRTCW